MFSFLTLLNNFDNWIKDILTNFIGALFGFGFALLLYYKQNSKDTQKEKKKTFQEHIDRLNYYSHLIDEVVVVFQENKKEVATFITDQKSNLLEIKILKQQ